MMPLADIISIKDVVLFDSLHYARTVPPGLSSIENDAHGIEKLLLKTQVS